SSNESGLQDHERSQREFHLAEKQIRDMQRWFQKVLEYAGTEDAAVVFITPFSRATISRFFDSAMRAHKPEDAGTTNEAFEEWAASIRPLLWFEWRCHLRNRLETDPASVCTRQ